MRSSRDPVRWMKYEHLSTLEDRKRISQEQLDRQAIDQFCSQNCEDFDRAMDRGEAQNYVDEESGVCCWPIFCFMKLGAQQWAKTFNMHGEYYCCSMADLHREVIPRIYRKGGVLVYWRRAVKGAGFWLRLQLIGKAGFVTAVWWKPSFASQSKRRKRNEGNALCTSHLAWFGEGKRDWDSSGFPEPDKTYKEALYMAVQDWERRWFIPTSQKTVRATGKGVLLMRNLHCMVWLRYSRNWVKTSGYWASIQEISF